jgi:hypothetical protein
LLRGAAWRCRQFGYVVDSDGTLFELFQLPAE